MHKINLSFVVLLALFIALPAKAQVKLGVIGGINIANLNGEDEDRTKIDFSSRTGFGIGGVLDLPMSTNVALHVEPMYLQKGAEFDLSDQDLGTAKATVKAAYLEVPVFVKVALGSSTARPYLMAGPTIGFNLSSTFGLSAAGLNAEMDANPVIKSTDFGLGFGAGVDIPIGANTFFVEGRYALGLSDVAEAGTFELMGEQLQVDNANVKTNGIQIMAGISFPLGGK